MCKVTGKVRGRTVALRRSTASCYVKLLKDKQTFNLLQQSVSMQRPRIVSAEGLIK